MEFNWKEAKFRNQFPEAREIHAEAIAAVTAATGATKVPQATGKAGGETESPADGATVELPAGSKVSIDGIKSRPEINGTVGTVIGYLPERERYNVKLDGGEELALKLTALSLIPPH